MYGPSNSRLPCIIRYPIFISQGGYLKPAIIVGFKELMLNSIAPERFIILQLGSINLGYLITVKG